MESEGLTRQRGDLGENSLHRKNKLRFWQCPIRGILLSNESGPERGSAVDGRDGSVSQGVGARAVPE